MLADMLAWSLGEVDNGAGMIRVSDPGFNVANASQNVVGVRRPVAIEVSRGTHGGPQQVRTSKFIEGDTVCERELNILRGKTFRLDKRSAVGIRKQRGDANPDQTTNPCRAEAGHQSARS